MPSPLQQLENNEAVLLMYAAGELPPDDRAEVEQMLSTDAGMRAELASIQSSLATVNAAMDDLDAITRLPMSSAVAARRLRPALMEWQQQRLAPPPPPPPAPTLRYAWWTYPIASAAAILLAAVVWWGVHSDESIGGAGALSPDGVPQQQEQLAGAPGPGFRSGEGPFFHGGGMMLMPLDPTDPEMNDAEQQVASLNRRSDDQTSNSSIFMTDAQTD